MIFAIKNCRWKRDSTHTFLVLYDMLNYTILKRLDH